VQGSPYLGVSGGGSDLTFDPNGNLWIAEGGGLYEFSSIGKELSPSTGFTNTGITDITSLGFDNKNNLWIGSLLSNGNHEFSELTWPGAQLVVTSLGAWNSAMLPVPVADNSGYLWIIGPDRVCKLSYSGTGLLSPGDSSCTSDDLSNTPGAQEQLGGYLPYMNARALALDGSDRLWIVSQGGPEGASTRSGNLISYPLTETSAYWWFSLDSSVLSGGVKSAAVDGSGNMWVLLANNTVAEYVGIATPTITPAALVLKNSKQGSKP
jgi:ligand-binding sensor domain-containing protein